MNTGKLKYILVFFFVYTGTVYGQEEWIQELEQNPLYQQFLAQQSEEGLDDLQTRVMEEGVMSLSESELDELLESMGIATTGSIIEKRERLRRRLGIAELPPLPDEIPRGSIGIENAAEGEIIQGEEGEDGMLILRGRIRVRITDGYFEADTVIIDSERGEIYAEGNLVYHEASARIEAERMLYDQNLGSGIIYNAEGYRDPLYFIGANVRIFQERNLTLSHTRFTSSAATPPHYSFRARRLWVYEDGQVAAAGVLYYVGGIPMLPLPFMYASQWGTGIISQMGVSQIQGFFWQNTYQFSVPTAHLSSWQPIAYRITADYYENTGEAFGIEMYRFSPNLNYVIDVGAANYKRYDLTFDYREFDRIRVTNQVLREDGTYGPESFQWSKAFAIVNHRRQDMAANSVQNFYLRYEDYTHRMYEFEFGGRYQPASTIPALYQNSEAGRGLIRDTTNWYMMYSDQRDDLSIRVEASRDNVWFERGNYRESEYLPLREVLPSVEIQKNIHMGNLPLLDVPVYWDNMLYSDVRRDFSGGDPFKTMNRNEFRSGLRTFFSFYPYITFEPKAGYGAQKTIPYGNDLSDTDFQTIERDAQRQSYEYWFTENSLTMGPDFLNLRAVYRRKDSFNEERKDRPELNFTGFTNNQKINETDLTLSFRPTHRIGFSVNTIYDHRHFDHEVAEKERWYYPVFRSDFTLDFLNMFRPERENLLSRSRRHFLEMRFTNDYVYDTLNSRDHSNVAGINFAAGGFDLWILKRLRYLEAGYHWYHNYQNPELDHMRFSLKGDVQLTRTLYLEMELESRAVDIERYSRKRSDGTEREDSITFDRDIIDGSGLAGRQRRQQTVFNIGFFETALVMDLQDWEFRLGYRMEQRSLLAGVNNFEFVNFYDNQVFVSMTLLRFDVGGTADQSSRFVVHRNRIRPGDLGRLPVGQGSGF